MTSPNNHLPQKVLVACEFSGRVREAFSQKGIRVVSVDLLNSETPCGPYASHWKMDAILAAYERGPWDLMIAHPPCTHLAVSGARWFKDKQQEQKAAIDFFLKLAAAPIHHICIENPIGIMSTKYRKPDQIVQPWMFGHGETKATCLWLKNLPKLQPSNIVDGREHKVHRMPPGPDRWKDRSRTYPGIAQSMADQWSVT